MMEMNIPQRISKLNIDNLDKSNFFQSLLKECYKLNILTISEIQSIQEQILIILKKQTEKYTLGESSSIKIETANNISQSFFYCIGYYLKTLKFENMIIKVIKEKSLMNIFDLGKKMITEDFHNSKKLLDILINNHVTIDNRAYNDTIENGISVFFNIYDIQFAAHDTPGNIDYPLGYDKMDLVGLEYINSYINKLSMENAFCKNFSEHDIRCLLNGYKKDYKELIINVFTLILYNVVGSILVGKSAKNININHSDRQYMKQKLSHVSKAELTIMIQSVTPQIYKELNITDISLQAYISLTLKNLPARLENALINNVLESLFISLDNTNNIPLYDFSENKKMDDESFRKITDEIRDCRFVSDKIAIIKNEIHCFSDLVDILEANCIFDDEFFYIFQSFEDMELSLLYKKVPEDLSHLYLHLTENERLWYERFNHFINDMDADKKEQIEKLSHQINI